ncbi:hypothetical protein Tco_0280400, partial [Tanacetum coccineum]
AAGRERDKEKDVELLPPRKGARHACKLLWKQGGESPWCLVAKNSFKMGQIAKMEVAGSIGPD